MATQAERSARTRALLLDATLACLGERGYRGTSTPEVCRRAGVSRGAQLHHFPTRAKLVAAAVEHLFVKRLAELREHFSRRRAAQSPAEAAKRVWAIYRGEAFYAWLELVVAARTDPALRAVLSQVDRRFTAAAEALVREQLVPEADRATVAAVTRLLLAIFDGLAQHRIVSGGRSAQAVLGLMGPALAAVGGAGSREGR